ncbi:MerR family transcriptional regulator [Dactylosporangium sp. CS-047395]|uniref:MerR family transcriptional regulator n=1 Tax=Dactylosporangium sp. CS-047395 TaxID=3239936 RepID=UPI003D8F9B79
MPTIKFYLREGLLPPGVPTARNQADYDETHLERLRLIRLLTTVGQLGLAAVRDILEAVDDKTLTRAELYQAVNGVLYADRVDGRLHEDVGNARQRVNEYLNALHWDVAATSPARETLAHVLVSFCRSGCASEREILGPYIEAARRLAAHELELLGDGDDVGPAVTAVRTVLFDVVMTTMRRLAQEAQTVHGPG